MRMARGREFQMVGAATRNERSANDKLVPWICSVAEEDDRGVR